MNVIDKSELACFYEYYTGDNPSADALVEEHFSFDFIDEPKSRGDLLRTVGDYHRYMIAKS